MLLLLSILFVMVSAESECTNDVSEIVRESKEGTLFFFIYQFSLILTVMTYVENTI